MGQHNKNSPFSFPEDEKVEKMNYPAGGASLIKSKYLIIFISIVLVSIVLVVLGFAVFKGSHRDAKNIQVEGNHVTMTLGKQNITAELTTKTKESFLVNSGELSSLNTGEFNVIPMETVRYLEQKYTDFIHCGSPGEEEGKSSLIYIGLIATTLTAEKEMKRVESLYKKGGNLVVIENTGSKLDKIEGLKREISNYGFIVTERVKPNIYYLVDDIKIVQERYQK